MTIPSEILAALITFVLTALLSYGVYFYKIHKGNKVFFEKVNESSLIQLSSQIRKDLSITYKNNPIEQLILYEFQIYNSGDKDIKDLRINIEFLDKENNVDSIIECLSTDYQNILNNSLLWARSGNRMLIVKRPYLNCRKKYPNEIIHMQVFSDSRLSFLVTGGEEGWSAEYSDKREQQKTIAKIGLGILALSIILMGSASLLSSDFRFLLYTGIALFFISMCISAYLQILSNKSMKK